MLGSKLPKLTTLMDLLEKIIKHNREENNYFDNRLSQIQEEGELKVDVFQKDNNIIVKSTIAGTDPADIDININNEILTIRGKRELGENIEAKDYLHRECYWGSFSRSIILPCEIQKGRIRAVIKRGILTIILPKITKKREIKVKELDD